MRDLGTRWRRRERGSRARAKRGARGEGRGERGGGGSTSRWADEWRIGVMRRCEGAVIPSLVDGWWRAKRSPRTASGSPSHQIDGEWQNEEARRGGAGRGSTLQTVHSSRRIHRLDTYTEPCATQCGSMDCSAAGSPDRGPRTGISKSRRRRKKRAGPCIVVSPRRREVARVARVALSHRELADPLCILWKQVSGRVTSCAGCSFGRGVCL